MPQSVPACRAFSGKDSTQAEPKEFEAHPPLLRGIFGRDCQGRSRLQVLLSASDVPLPLRRPPAFE